MDIRLKSQEFLHLLYFKTKNDFGSPVAVDNFTEHLQIDTTQNTNVLEYLEQKGFVQTSNIGYTKLTSMGIDHILVKRENKNYVQIKFESYKYLDSSRDAIEYLFLYTIGENDQNVESKNIKVSISGTLAMYWGFNIWSGNHNSDYRELVKIFIHLAKNKIEEKYKEGSLLDNEEIMYLSNHEIQKPVVNKRSNQIETEFEFEISSFTPLLAEEIQENKLAAAIIETRDIINSLFYNLAKTKILLLDEERNLLDFFKQANSEEEYSHRLASLGQVSRNLNIDILRRLTQQTDTKIGSIVLLEMYFTSLGHTSQNITTVLKKIGRIRQGYPIHTDKANVIDSYNFFKIAYPVTEYSKTWIKLLEHYLTALQEFKEILDKQYFEKCSR
jgi:hypothetical protein